MRTIEQSTILLARLQLTDDSSKRRLATASSQVLSLRVKSKDSELKNLELVVNTKYYMHIKTGQVLFLAD